MNLRFWKRKPKRLVLLIASDEMKIVEAKESQSGWIARFHDIEERWSLLCKDGRVYPPSYVNRWAPHSGWHGAEEFPRLEDKNA